MVLVTRWVHFTSVLLLLGSAFYGRLVLAPALQSLESAERVKLWDRAAARSRWVVIVAVFGVLASGLYNVVTRAGLTGVYLVWFGVKMLLVLHIFAVSLLAAKPGVEPEKRVRWMTGIMISGLLVILVSVGLRLMQ